jgi:hypothetical protein
LAPYVRHRKRRNDRDLKRVHRPPADRPAVRVTYFPGEAARILKLQDIDYHQMRRLFEIIDPSLLRAEAERSGKSWTWTRYSFRHLVALRTALSLAPPQEGGRLNIRQLREACLVLRGQFGRASPLTDTQLSRLGDAIVARIGGKLFDARTGQRLIDEVATSVKDFVRTHCKEATQACLKQVREHSKELLTEARSGREAVAVMAATSRGRT